MSSEYRFDVIKQFHSKIIDEKFEFLEKKLVKIKKCPENEVHFT